ncbi:MAG: hypothetical protein C0507_00425 [Cyanobacteria bacterium PR.3.49]|jgi:pimeloyl-ACP methyl ester carboxylesterase|nr:hypothetical protein [Cyanobacteria bacterium PR.3.49]
MPAQLNKTCKAILISLLIWLGLSPQVSRFFYEMALMPRLRCDDPVYDGLDFGTVQTVSFPSMLKRLEGRFYNCPDSRKLVVFFGGRRSNFRTSSLRAEALLKLGVSVFIFEYRGFGDAPGKATSKSILQDGLAAYDAARDLGFSPDNIILYGESLGVAIASFVSSKRPACALILQSGFANLETQIKDLIPLTRMYPGFMFPEQNLSAANYIAGNHPPLLILHGDRDPVVREKHAHKLAEAAGDNTTLVILRGADHGEVYERKDWMEAVGAFLT